MSAAKTVQSKSPRLQRVMERAKRNPEERILSLASLLDEQLLKESYEKLRIGAAVGVDGVTKEAYGRNLEENIAGLYERMRMWKWRHDPIRRVEIPKGNGKTRPLGISTTESKIVQQGLTMVLTAIYEPVFKDFSYGFRPGRSAHDAVRRLNREVHEKNINWIIDADISSYFDTIDRKQLKSFMERRIADKDFMRLVGKCLHVGVLEGEQYSEPEEGTVQGSVISPILGNIYLHYVLDEWFDQEVIPRMKGGAFLIRYADDAVIGFELEADARRVLEVLGKRFEKYNLKLHPEKTRLVEFKRPRMNQREGKGAGTFDFLGFTHYWRRTGRGTWRMWSKTRLVSYRKAIKSLGEYCRRQRHAPIKEQHTKLSSKLRGHFNYFGVNGNSKMLDKVRYAAVRLWHKWLNRRSQRARKSWERFNDMLRDFPLPQPRICKQIWG